MYFTPPEPQAQNDLCYF